MSLQDLGFSQHKTQINSLNTWTELLMYTQMKQKQKTPKGEPETLPLDGIVNLHYLPLPNFILESLCGDIFKW